LDKKTLPSIMVTKRVVGRDTCDVIYSVGHPYYTFSHNFYI